MSKKKTVHVVADDIFPQALIIGDSPLVQMLLDSLKVRGCNVKLTKNPQEILLADSPLRFDYIFEIDSSVSANEIKNKLLSREGKFLLIELEKEFNNLEKLGQEFKVFRAGIISLWESRDLTGRIFKTIFSKETSGITDERKIAEVKKDPPLDLSKPIVRKEVVTRTFSEPKPFIPIKSSPESKQQPEITHRRKKISRRFVIFLIIFLVIILGISASVGWYFMSFKKSLSYLKIHLA